MLTAVPKQNVQQLIESTDKFLSLAEPNTNLINRHLKQAKVKQSFSDCGFAVLAFRTF
jgi:chemotaxis regulatin CheY-phosphate phosphatase CheZ